MKPLVGRTPQGGEALGVYGSSWFWAGWAAFALVLGVVGAILSPLDSTVSNIAGLLLWVVIFLVVVFTPTLVVTEQEIIRRGRPLRPPIKWTEVAEVLPPGPLSDFMRVRLTDRTVVTLQHVGKEKAQSLTAIMAAARVS